MICVGGMEWKNIKKEAARRKAVKENGQEVPQGDSGRQETARAVTVTSAAVDASADINVAFEEKATQSATRPKTTAANGNAGNSIV